MKIVIGESREFFSKKSKSTPKKSLLGCAGLTACSVCCVALDIPDTMLFAAAMPFASQGFGYFFAIIIRFPRFVVI